MTPATFPLEQPRLTLGMGDHKKFIFSSYPFVHLLERTIQQVPLVAVARNLGELEPISDLSQPIMRTPFRNCDPISQHSGESYEYKWLIEPAGDGGVLKGPAVVADGRPVEIHVPLRHSRTRAAFGLSLQADLSCDENVDF